MTHENHVVYTVLPSGNLRMIFYVSGKEEIIIVPGNIIIEQQVKSKKYSTFVSEYAHQYFAVRKIGAYEIRRIDMDRN